MSRLRRGLRRLRDVDAFLVVLLVVGALLVAMTVFWVKAVWDNRHGFDDESGVPVHLVLT